MIFGGVSPLVDGGIRFADENWCSLDGCSQVMDLLARGTLCSKPRDTECSTLRLVAKQLLAASADNP